jgi:predicted transcriptional regulator
MTTVKKEQISIYLDPAVARALKDYAGHRRKSLSLIAEAAIASFTSPDAAERQEAATTKRLDRISRQMERVQRDLGVSTEALALFVRFWLQATPQSPEHQQPAARAKGSERYSEFIQALGQRLANGTGLPEEVSIDRASDAVSHD